jgi:TusA-related sulfurtransferase
MNWVRVKLALEGLEPGEALDVVLDPGEPLDSVPQSAEDDGYLVTVVGQKVTITK